MSARRGCGWCNMAVSLVLLVLVAAVVVRVAQWLDRGLF